MGVQLRAVRAYQRKTDLIGVVSGVPHKTGGETTAEGDRHGVYGRGVGEMVVNSL